jgi:hypothetical protein
LSLSGKKRQYENPANTRITMPCRNENGKKQGKIEVGLVCLPVFDEIDMRPAKITSAG